MKDILVTVKVYHSLREVPERLRPYAVPKDYGIDEDSGKCTVIYKVYLESLPKELYDLFNEGEQ